MRSLIETIKQKRRAAPKSFALLLVLLGCIVAAYLLAFFYFRQDVFKLWSCSFRRLTGLHCLGCGNTHAVEALLQFRLLDSVRHNPTPLLVAVFLLAIMVHSAINVARGKDRKFPLFWVWFYGILGIILLFCVLKNIGIL